MIVKIKTLINDARTSVRKRPLTWVTVASIWGSFYY